MSFENIHFTKNAEEPLELNILRARYWDDFDKLIFFVKTQYSAEILEQCDDIISRRCVLKAGGQVFELNYDDLFGNYFLAHEDEDIVYKIGEDLENKFKNNPTWLKNLA